LNCSGRRAWHPSPLEGESLRAAVSGTSTKASRFVPRVLRGESRGDPGTNSFGSGSGICFTANRARHQTAVCRVKPGPVRESSTKNVVAAEQSEAAPVSFVSIRDSNHPIAFHSCPFVVQTTLLHSIRVHSWFKPPSCIPFVSIRGSNHPLAFHSWPFVVQNHPLASHSWPFVIQTTLLPPIRGHS
jgi:hypothetical protein